MVVVEDADGNPVPGVAVTFAAPTSGASAALSSATATTGGDGQASVDAIVDTLAARFNAPREEIAGDVAEMLQDLADKGCLADADR